MIFSNKFQVYKSRQFKLAKSINKKTTASSATIVQFYEDISMNNSTIIKRAIAIGKVTLYNAKIIALAIRISITVAKSKNYTESISIFADNLLALYTIINLKKGALQIKVIQASCQIKKFLNGNPMRRVYFL